MAVTYQVPLSYTINVLLSSTPTGLADFNINSIAIFSNEAPAFSESYQAYLTPSAVASDFGTNSLTYKMAQALFTPVPNFRTGGGVLYVFPFNGTNATSGSFTTPDISDNVTAFKSVTNGSLNITIDSVNSIVTGLDFSTVTTVKDIVTVLNKKGLDVYIEEDADTIRFTSKKFGTDSGVVISAITEGSGTDISAAAYLDASNGTTTAGTAASGTSLSNAVSAALKEVYFGGVLSTQYVDDTAYLANSTAIQALDCDYFEAMTSLKDIAITGAAIKSAGNGKTRTLAYSQGAQTAKIAIATYASIAKSVNYNGSNTANTMNLKTLTGIVADSGLSDTYVLSAQTNGVDIYGNTGGLSVVYSNDNNGYTDDIEAQLWVKKSVEVALFNVLRQTNTKIAQTEAGVATLKNALAMVCEQSIRNGVAAPGTWNSAETFGDPEDFVRNIAEKGYYIYSQPISQQPQADREARKCPVIQCAIKLAGAIHSASVIINVER